MTIDMEKVADFTIRMQNKGMEKELIGYVLQIFKNEFEKRSEPFINCSTNSYGSDIYTNYLNRTKDKRFW